MANSPSIPAPNSSNKLSLGAYRPAPAKGPHCGLAGDVAASDPCWGHLGWSATWGCALHVLLPAKLPSVVWQSGVLNDVPLLDGDDSSTVPTR